MVEKKRRNMKMFPLPEEVKGWGGFYKSQCKSRDKYYLLFEEKALEVPTVQRGGRGGGGQRKPFKTERSRIRRNKRPLPVVLVVETLSSALDLLMKAVCTADVRNSKRGVLDMLVQYDKKKTHM